MDETWTGPYKSSSVSPVTDFGPLLARVNGAAERFRSTLGSEVEDIAQDAVVLALTGECAPDDIADVVARLANQANNARYTRTGGRGAQTYTGARMVPVNDAAMLANIADARDPRLTPVTDEDFAEWARVTGGTGATGHDSKGRPVAEGLTSARMTVPGVADTTPSEVVTEAAASIGAHHALNDLRARLATSKNGARLPARLIDAIRDAVPTVMRQHAREAGRTKPHADRWAMATLTNSALWCAHWQTQPVDAGRTWAHVADDAVSRPATDERACCVACLPVIPPVGAPDECDHAPLPVKRPRVIRPHTTDPESDGLALLSLGSGPVRKASRRRKGGSGATGPTVMVGGGRRWTDAGKGDHS